MPKLHLKRTPAEEEAHQLRKARKAVRKAAKARSRLKRASVDDEDEGDDNEDEGYHKRPRTQEYTPSGSEETYDPYPAQLRTTLEEERFYEKMYEAQEDDAGIYGLEERWSAYPGIHIPERWRVPGEPVKGPDPRYMGDEEYAEWIRVEMWKRKHPTEHADAQRVQSQRSARLARTRALTELTRAREEERKKRKEEREKRRWEEARGIYERRWGVLSVGVSGAGGGGGLKFEDIPWPVYEANRDSSKTTQLSLDSLTSSTISAFILPPDETEVSPNTPNSNPPTSNTPTRKNRLRETLLRFHPDKFEGRVMGRVIPEGEEREKVREGVGRVVRALNELMGERG